MVVFGNEYYSVPDDDAGTVTSVDRIKAICDQAPVSGTLDSIVVKFSTTSVSSKARCAVYNYVDYHTDFASDLLDNGTSEEKDINLGTIGWVTFNFTGTKPVLVSGTSYYLAVHIEDNSEGGSPNDITSAYKLRLRSYSGVGKNGVNNVHAYASGFEDPLDSETATETFYYIYGNCTEVSGEYSLPSDKISIDYNASYVTLDMPSSILESTTNSVQNLVFNDGTDIQFNRGKMSDALTLSGQETSSATYAMQTLNTFMDDQRTVTVSGLPDSNLNTDYRIICLDFRQEAGYINRYSYSITLERISDRL